MSVVITKPTSGATLTGVALVQATYSGSNFEIATVTIDGQQLASDTSQPLSFSIDTSRVADGSHTLTVAVRYRSGGQRRWQKASIPITTEGNDMKVDITTDKGITNLTGTVVVTATITPSQQAASPVRCDFYVDGAIKASDTSYPLTFSWDTTKVADGGHTIRANVVAGNRVRDDSISVGVKNTAVPPPPPPVQAVPVNITSPAISGTATQGQVLTCSNGTWTDSPTSYTRQWSRCDASGANALPIGSATGPSYQLTAADVGSTIRCWTTAFNSVGPSIPIQTAQTAVVAAIAAAVPVNVTIPTLAGQAAQGNTLISSNGAWTNAPTSYTYQWKRCDSAGANCTNISGATSSSYVLTSTDVTKTVRSAVTAVNGTGSSTAAQSAPSMVVAALPPPGPGMPNFPPPAFTPSRTIVCTSASAFSSAWSGLQAGDYLDVRGVTFSGEQVFSKSLANFAEVHFDANCRFLGDAAGSSLPSVWVHDCQKVRFYGGNITGAGNDGIRFDDNINILWWDFFVHDTAGTGVQVRGLSHATSNLDLRGTITHCGLDLSLDPHAEKGTGNHAYNMGTGTGQLVTDSRFVLTVYDQPYGAAVEVQGVQNSTLYLDARRVTFQAQSQTAGNAIQFWGDDTVNFTCPYLYADVMGGRAVEADGGLNSSNSNIRFTYGRASNCRLSEYASDPVISYSDCS